MMLRKLVAEFIGTAWLVLGGCGSAVLGVRPLTITMADAMAIVKRMGLGSAEALGNVDFALPENVRA
jgi:glycerol uptake facilitator-like aquaporin